MNQAIFNIVMIATKTTYVWQLCNGLKLASGNSKQVGEAISCWGGNSWSMATGRRDGDERVGEDKRPDEWKFGIMSWAPKGTIGDSSY